MRIFGALRPWPLLCAGLAVIGLLCLAEVSKRTWIPNANLLHTANVAAGFSRGEGYVSSSLRDYLPPRKSVVHPEDVIPLGFPTAMGIFFAVAGATIHAAYLPSIFFFILCGLATYWVGKSRFGTGAGLAAAFLLWTDVKMTLVTVYGMANTGFILFFILALHFMASSWEKDSKPGTAVWAGISSGLAFHMKFEGVILPLAFVIMLIGAVMWDGVEANRLRFKRFAVFACFFLLLLLPWFARNIYHFRSPLYPAMFNRCAAKIVKPGLVDNPNPINTFQTVYTDENFPAYSGIVSEGGFYNFFIKRPRVETFRLIRWILKYQIVGLGLMLFGMLGAFWCWTGDHKNWILWNIVVAFSSILWIFKGGLEQTDFYAFIPSATLLCAYFIVEFGKWIRNEVSARTAITFGLTMTILFGVTFYYNWKYILRKAQPEGISLKLEVLNRWISSNVKPGEAIITRMPQYVSWGSMRPAIATPMTDWKGFMEIAEKYGAGYLLIEYGQLTAEGLSKQETSGLPLMEWLPLFRGEESFGARKVYEQDDVFLLYRLPSGGNGP